MNTTTLDDRYVSADHIGAARDRGRIITLCAAMGMGKSTAIREYLRRMGDPPVMFVACRVLQSTDGATAYVLTHYQNGEAPSARCVSTTVHSLNKFTQWLDDPRRNSIDLRKHVRSQYISGMRPARSTRQDDENAMCHRSRCWPALWRYVSRLLHRARIGRITRMFAKTVAANGRGSVWRGR